MISHFYLTDSREHLIFWHRNHVQNMMRTLCQICYKSLLNKLYYFLIQRIFYCGSTFLQETPRSIRLFLQLAYTRSFCVFILYISYLNTLSWNQPLTASLERLLYSTLQTFDFPFLSHYTKWLQNSSILTQGNCMRTAARSLHEICTWKQNWIFLI